MAVGTATAVVSCFSLTPEEFGSTASAASFTAGCFFFNLLPIGLARSPFDHEQVSSMIGEEKDYNEWQSEIQLHSGELRRGLLQKNDKYIHRETYK